MNVIPSGLTRQQRYTASLLLAALLIGCGILAGWRTRPASVSSGASPEAWVAEAGEKFQGESQNKPQNKSQNEASRATTSSAGPEDNTPGIAPQNPPQVIRVHVCGAVKSPGVYEVPPGARAIDAVKLAGGTTPDADLLAINLAAEVSDGQQVYVPPRQPDTGGSKPRPALIAGTPIAGGGPGGGETREVAKAAEHVTAPPGSQDARGRTAKLNINTCSASDLEALPGIGPVLARRIIEYRTAKGPFKSPEELINVPGIGPKKLEMLLPLVTVG